MIVRAILSEILFEDFIILSFQVASNLSTPLIFSLNRKDRPPVIMNGSCLDQSFTALCSMDPEFYDLTINVTVSAEDCSNSTVMMTSGITSKRIKILIPA